MADREKNPEEILLDARDANLRYYGGSIIQTIPKKWLRRVDLQAFFRSELEIALVHVNGQPHIEIRRKQWAVEDDQK
ncbi:MAG: hypothetical protein DRG83_05350 [Deltaproteobacteria bacterium]|nr:MAG: hypothetical protein DRG83_05350 [Deltaproteobacteria bacterium]